MFCRILNRTNTENYNLNDHHVVTWSRKYRIQTLRNGCLCKFHLAVIHSVRLVLIDRRKLEPERQTSHAAAAKRPLLARLKVELLIFC